MKLFKNNLLMQKTTFLFITFWGMALRLAAQTTSDMLENSLSGVVTVAVYENKVVNKLYGFRGTPSISQTAYEKALNLMGANSTGSGFVIAHDGQKFIVTNAHVVDLAAESDSAIAVFSVSRKKYWMKVVGGDSFYDIAVLAFITPPTDELQPLSFRSATARLGEKVFAIGNPLGEYPYSVTDGIISAKNRVREGITGKFGFLQSTATVIWGNSGGPLIDEHGNVVGVNSQIAFAKQGRSQIWQPQINFALESAIVKRLVNDILSNKGMVRRAYLGIEVSTKKNQLDVPTFENFPIISKLMEDAPLELSNAIGHEIHAINGIETRNLEEILGELEKVLPTDTVNLTLSDKSKTYNLSVPTKSLTTESLENLAKNILNDWEINLEEQQGKLFYTEKKEVIIPAKKIAGKPTPPPKTKIIDEKKYLLLAGSNDSETLWFVENLIDLGGILRLTGLLGRINLFVSADTDPNGNLDTIHEIFTNKQGDDILILWY